MLLCPEQNHTSPTTTFLNVSAFSPATRNSPPSAHALSGASAVFQRPCASAVAVAVCPANDTVTFSPGAALPHTGTRCPCWSTMLSPNTCGIVTAAAHSAAANSAAATVNKIFFICFSFQSYGHSTIPPSRRKARKCEPGIRNSPTASVSPTLRPPPHLHHVPHPPRNSTPIQDFIRTVIGACSGAGEGRLAGSGEKRKYDRVNPIARCGVYLIDLTEGDKRCPIEKLQ